MEAEDETKYKCLIVNDDPSQLFFLKLIFELEKFEVTTAQNGQEAFDIVSNLFKNKIKKKNSR